MKIETRLKIIAQEFNVLITEPVAITRVIWATGSTIKRCTYNPDITFELNEDNKVYILERLRATSLMLEGICDAPSKELITFIEKWAQ